MISPSFPFIGDHASTKVRKYAGSPNSLPSKYGDTSQGDIEPYATDESESDIPGQSECALRGSFLPLPKSVIRLCQGYSDGSVASAVYLRNGPLPHFFCPAFSISFEVFVNKYSSDVYSNNPCRIIFDLEIK